MSCMYMTFKYPRKEMRVAQSCLTLCNPKDCNSPGSCLWNSLGKNTGVDSHVLLQGIIPIQGSNPGLPHCRQILYNLATSGAHIKRSSASNSVLPSGRAPGCRARLAQNSRYVLFSPSFSKSMFLKRWGMRPGRDFRISA